MFKIFKPRHKTTVYPDAIELNIAADGQLSVSGIIDLQVPVSELESLINEHVAELRHDLDATISTDAAAVSLRQVQQSLKSAEDDKANKLYVRSFHNLAEACDSLAQLTGNWDLGWRIFNKEALKILIAVSRGRQDVLTNDYTELLFARGVHFLREMRYSADKTAKNNAAQSAVRAFYVYLMVMHQLGLTHWQQRDAARNIQLAVILGMVTANQQNDILGSLAHRQATQSSREALKQAAQNVQAYQLTESNPEKLAALIY